MKSLSTFRTVIFILFVDDAIAEWSSTEVAHSFTCYTSHNNDNKTSVVWSFQNKSTNSDTPLFLCSTLSNKCDVSFDNVLEFYSANLTTNTSIITSVFTIKSVTPFQNGTLWLCSGKHQGVTVMEGIFDLFVFSAPETPSCEKIALMNQNYIRVDCSTQRVFPKSVCSFFIITNNTTPNVLTNGHINSTHIQNVATGYYNTSCTFTVLTEVIGPGTHLFYVVMYPDITANISNDMKKRSQNTSSIVINYPEAVLGPDCNVNRYIQENETGYCTCYNSNSNFLPTQVTWSTGEYEFESKNSTLTFTAKKPVKESQLFRCMISNSLNWTNTIIFQPQIAYGPDSVMIILNNSDKQVCDDTSLVIAGTCQVSESNPFSTVYFIVNGSWIQLRPGTERNEYRFTIPSFTSGTLNVSCYANNSIFGHISSLDSQLLLSKAISPRIISISNSIAISPSNNVLTVYEGVTTFVCESDEKDVFYQNISLTCGDFHRSFTNSDTVFLKLNLKKETVNLNCSCQAWPHLYCPLTTASFKIVVLQSETDINKEINVLAIVLGVAAALEFLILIIILLKILLWRNKQERASRTHKKSEEYSDLKDTPYKEPVHTYETPIVNTEVLSAHQISNSKVVHKPQIHTIQTSSNQLGEYFVKADREIEVAQTTIHENNEEYAKTYNHPYEEVKDHTEINAGQLYKKEGSSSYSNVTMN